MTFFDEGVHAASVSDVDDCPYQIGSAAHADWVNGYCSVADDVVDMEPDSDDVDDCLEPDDWWYFDEYTVSGAFQHLVSVVARTETGGSWFLKDLALDYVESLVGRLRDDSGRFPTTRAFVSKCAEVSLSPHGVLELAISARLREAP